MGDPSKGAAIRAAMGMPTTPAVISTDAYTQTIRMLSGALRAIHERLIYARREGDEWAAEFLAEEWPDLVPEEVRRMFKLDDD